MNQSPNNQKVCIVGMGFVGLTLAVVMAERGFQVLGLESDLQKLSLLKNYQVHFHEEGLADRCKAVVDSGALKFEHPVQEGTLTDYQVFILTVGTPLDESGEPSMTMVTRSAKYVAELMPDGAMVILRSTVKLGTTRSVVLPILEESGKTFDLAYCSERTLEGRALKELRELPQIIGSLNVESAARADEIFQRITPEVYHVSSLEAAEMIKLLDNSYRDYMFAFGNEVAMICEAAGLNASEIIKTANSNYERTNIPRPGFVGGPCLEKDPHILCSSLQPLGFTPRLVKLARTQNEYLPLHAIDLVEAWVKRHKIEGRLIFWIHGIAFKAFPETDDVRGTPVKSLINTIKQRWPDAVIWGTDPICSWQQIEEVGARGMETTATPIEDKYGPTISIVTNAHPENMEWINRALITKPYDKLLVLDCSGTLTRPDVTLAENVEYRKLGDNG